MKYIVQEKKMRHEDRRNITTLRFYGIFDSEGEAEEYASTIKSCVASVYPLVQIQFENPVLFAECQLQDKSGAGIEC